MSRGPGKMQRAILDTLAAEPDGAGLCITHPEQTLAEQNSLRRAAYALESAGKLVITSQRVDGSPRLVAYLPGDRAPAFLRVVGRDGKTYRQPAFPQVSGVSDGW